jgi:asparagine synthase (glutamine-hydrolysing)
MCGIYGQWNLTGASIRPASVQRATTLLRHRGPDDEGYLLGDTRTSRYVACAGAETTAAMALPRIEQFRTESFDFAFGFRRLSILDLSPLGHQPMASADGRYWIVFNGEIYNYRELRAELSGYGHRFRGGSDTEVILAAFQQWGTGCLQRFNGMWAFAVWDTGEKQLFLARDRFGVKPLHYTWDGARFGFASEIKALLSSDGASSAADDQAVYDYLVSGGMPSPAEGRTFFRDVRALPPAHWMTVGQGRLTVQRYYALPDGQGNGHSRAEGAVTRYRDLLTDAIRIRLRSDVPVGTCLSGGVDSSSIVCVINRLMAEDGVAAAQVGERQKTFSAVYDRPGRFNESRYIETVLQATGAEGNFTIPTAERLAGDLKQLIWHQDEPFGSTSIYAQWCVMAKVRERGVTVLLDGQGADEALGGYRPYDVLLADLLRRGRYFSALGVSRDMRATTGISQLAVWGRALARQAPERYLDRVRRFRDRGKAALLQPHLQGFRPGTTAQPKVYRGLASHLQELVTETSLPHLLRYEDRNGMAFGVEGRVPFVDYRLVEFALTEGLRWCVHHGWTKWILRESMRDIVPSSIVWRRDKVGFETPESEWLETLLTQSRELLHSGAKSGVYVDLEHAGPRAERWLRENRDTGPLWRLLNLELWLQNMSGAGAAPRVSTVYA